MWVVEKSIDVLTWYKKYFRAKVLRELNDEKVRFIPGDVSDVFFDMDRRFNLIVLDVDNGPEAISGASNNELYSADGLAQIAKCLHPGGALLLWSGFTSDLFESTARSVGFSVSLEAVGIGHPKEQHYIYTLRPHS